MDFVHIGCVKKKKREPKPPLRKTPETPEWCLEILMCLMHVMFTIYTTLHHHTTPPHYTTWIEGKKEIRMDGRSAASKQEDCRHFDMIPYDLAFVDLD